MVKEPLYSFFWGEIEIAPVVMAARHLLLNFLYVLARCCRPQIVVRILLRREFVHFLRNLHRAQLQLPLLYSPSSVTRAVILISTSPSGE